MRRMWVLGAPDPEMQLIEGLLAEAGEQVAHALDATGQRVHPGAAYRATALTAPVPEGAAVYAVECGGPAIPAGAVAIDHHRPGDPGYGRQSEEHTSELQSREKLVCRLLLEKKKMRTKGPAS